MAILPALPRGRLRTLSGTAGANPGVARLREELARRERRVKEQLGQLDNWNWQFDRFYDPQFGYFGGLGGAGYGFPADRSQDRTHSPLPYLTEIEWRTHLALSRDLVQRNGLALGFRDHVRAFIGPMSVSFVLRGQSPGPSPSGPVDADGDGEPDVHPLVKQAMAVWDEWRRLNRWGCGIVNREKECVNRLITEGESLLRFFRGDSATRGIPRTRHVEPELVRSPDGGATGPAGWGIECDPDDAETVLRYWVCRSDDPTRGNWVPAARVAHVKNNVDGTVKRGLSDFFPVAGLLRKTLEIRENMAHTQRVLSAILWWEQYPTATEEQIRNMIEAGRDYQVVRPGFGASGAGARTADVQVYDPGTVVRTEAGRQVVPPPAAVNTGNFVQSDEMVLRGISFRWGLPDFMAGRGAASFAGLLVKGSPLVALTEERQDLVKGFTGEIAVRVLELAEESGRLPRGASEELEPVVTARPVEIADEEKKARTSISYYEKGLKSPFKIMAENGDTPKQVMADLAAHKKQLAEMGGPPGAPPPGAPPRPNPGPNSTPPGSAGGDQSSPNNPAAESRVSEAGQPPWPGAVLTGDPPRWHNPHTGETASPADTVATMPENDLRVLAIRMGVPSRGVPVGKLRKDVAAAAAKLPAEKPAGVDRPKLYRDLTDAVSAQGEEHGSGARFDVLYAKLKGTHPGLTPAEFKGALRKLAADGHIALSGWNESTDDVPDKSLNVYHHGGDTPKDAEDLLYYHATPPGWHGATPKTASPEASAAPEPPAHAKVVADLAAAEPDKDARDYLESALANHDGTAADLAEQLGASIESARGEGGALKRRDVPPAAHAAVRKALVALGATPEGPGAGEPATMSNRLYEPLGAGHGTGDPVEVVHPPLVFGGKVVSKGVVKPTGRATESRVSEAFTGVDTNGHHWVNGRQVKAGDDEGQGHAKAAAGHHGAVRKAMDALGIPHEHLSDEELHAHLEAVKAKGEKPASKAAPKPAPAATGPAPEVAVVVATLKDIQDRAVADLGYTAAARHDIQKALSALSIPALQKVYAALGYPSKLPPGRDKAVAEIETAVMHLPGAVHRAKI